MHTNVDVDEGLIAEAMGAAGSPTEKATVWEASRWLVRRRWQHEAIRDMAGLGWDGDLDAMRGGRDPEPQP